MLLLRRGEGVAGWHKRRRGRNDRHGQLAAAATQRRLLACCCLLLLLLECQRSCLLLLLLLPLGLGGGGSLDAPLLGHFLDAFAFGLFVSSPLGLLLPAPLGVLLLALSLLELELLGLGQLLLVLLLLGLGALLGLVVVLLPDLLLLLALGSLQLGHALAVLGLLGQQLEATLLVLLRAHQLAGRGDEARRWWWWRRLRCGRCGWQMRVAGGGERALSGARQRGDIDQRVVGVRGMHGRALDDGDRRGGHGRRRLADHAGRFDAAC